MGNKNNKKNKPKEERKDTTLSSEEKFILWKWLVLAELHISVHISNKEVAVNPKFALHDVRNEVSFSLCKYQPWYKNINNRLEW